jgi:endogenous inhibitor of DNA gyrase (YacG/DUF329 family)
MNKTTVNCKECDKEVPQQQAGRTKWFCGITCRNKFHNKKLVGKSFKKIPMEEWKEIEAENEIAKILAGGFSEEDRKIMANCLLEGMPVISYQTTDSIKILHPETKEYWDKYEQFKNDKSFPFVNTKMAKSFTNAARGRDESGINEDEVKSVEVDRDEIKSQIAAIQSEKIPKERDTIYGRKIWQKEQDKKIAELKNKLQ